MWLTIIAPHPRGMHSHSSIRGASMLHKGLCFCCPVVLCFCCPVMLPFSEARSCSPGLLRSSTACTGRTSLAPCPAVLPRGSGDVAQCLGLGRRRWWQGSVCLSIQPGRTQAMIAGRSPEQRRSRHFYERNTVCWRKRTSPSHSPNLCFN